MKYNNNNNASVPNCIVNTNCKAKYKKVARGVSIKIVILCSAQVEPACCEADFIVEHSETFQGFCNTQVGHCKFLRQTLEDFYLSF